MLLGTLGSQRLHISLMQLHIQNVIFTTNMGSMDDCHVMCVHFHPFTYMLLSPTPFMCMHDPFSPIPFMCIILLAPLPSCACSEHIACVAGSQCSCFEKNSDFAEVDSTS